MKNKSLSQKSERIKSVEKIKIVIDDTQKIVGNVDNITKVISSTFYLKGDIAVDLQNYSLIGVSDPKDII